MSTSLNDSTEWLNITLHTLSSSACCASYSYSSFSPAGARALLNALLEQVDSRQHAHQLATGKSTHQHQVPWP